MEVIADYAKQLPLVTEIHGQPNSVATHAGLEDCSYSSSGCSLAAAVVYPFRGPCLCFFLLLFVAIAPCGAFCYLRAWPFDSDWARVLPGSFPPKLFKKNNKKENFVIS